MKIEEVVDKMSLLSDDDKEEVKKILSDMTDTVTVHIFTDDDCQYCDETIGLNEELLELTDKIDLQKHDLNNGISEELGANDYKGAPVIVMQNEGIGGVRYFGIPSGQEFQSYLQDLIAVSNRETDLDEKIKEDVKEIDQEVNIKVFVTPSCPYCPRAVLTAHKFAIENENITADMIEAQEFMEVSQEYDVGSVPQININGKENEFTGALPADEFLDKIFQALR